MKTQFLTIATIVTLALGTVTTAFATDKNNNNENSTTLTDKNNNNENSTTLTNVSKINKIELHGNVELYVSDGSADQVKVYNKYYAENAFVQSQNGVLRISSYADQKLVVWVTANDLRSITAYDNASVKSFGDLSKIDLNVTLNNNATADLKLDAFKASINVNDRAKANISGVVNEYDLKHDQSATVNQTNLVAGNANKTITNKFVKANDAELAVL